MKPIKLSLLIATLLFPCVASAQTSHAGDGISAAQVNAIYPDIETLYIDLHRNPELAFHEQRTAATLTARVKALGYEVTTGVGGTGIVAILKNGAGPVVMLRTELDALPIEEKTGLPFASTVKTKNDAGEIVPVAHMCGHDLHMAAWAGTAELMAKNRERWHGTLMLVGQPAEEIVAGATAMLRDGLFTRFPKPDYALGVHDEHTLPAGVIGFHSGYFRANSTGLDMTVYGKGGHGAFPQSAIDPVVIAARIVLSLQTIVSREINPLDPAVITVGSIHGGSASNIIPDQVKLQITVRSLDPAVHKRLLAAIARQAKGEALAANAPKEPLIETKSNTDAVYNDPELTQRMAAAARRAARRPGDRDACTDGGRRLLAIRAGRRARRAAARRRGRCGKTRGVAQIRRAGSGSALAAMGSGPRANDQGRDPRGDGDPDGLA
jgi:hippurate hydrolase